MLHRDKDYQAYLEARSRHADDVNMSYQQWQGMNLLHRAAIETYDRFCRKYNPFDVRRYNWQVNLEAEKQLRALGYYEWKLRY